MYVCYQQNGFYRLKKISVILFLLMVTTVVGAQNFNNLKEKIIWVDADSILIDTLSIIPGSEQVSEGDSLIDKQLYSFDFGKALFFPDSFLKGKTLKLVYRTFWLNFTKPYFHKDYATYRNKSGTKPTRFSLNNSPSIQGSFLNNSQLHKQGSISRGISFGNNQDAILNSSLNLQMSGKLNNEFNIRAAITDDNIPIQPDGNSQQIQEFDKVFIEVFNKKTSLTVGDFEINSSRGSFLRLKKKAQGGLFGTKLKLSEKKDNQLTVKVGAAVSKGQYNRMFFNGTEGNQGPYKLYGANNENYIIVLAGSEQVYIDGRLLERGLDKDYTIDYNQAELSFTPNQPITKDKRITVEFEYSDRNYARFMLYTENEYQHEKGKFYVSFFSNQDSKNQPLQQDLSDSQKELLATIGDSLDQAISPNIEEMEFSNDYVLYKQIDSLVNGFTYSPVYKYSTHIDSARYRLGFSYVGAGNGNYTPVQSLANGKVYGWVAPINGVLQGDYEPVVLLVTPKKKQVVVLGGEYTLSKNSMLDFELAISNNDLNTFSDLHNDDNLGMALDLGFDRQFEKGKKGIAGLLKTRYQMLNRNFDAVENFRPVEFSRNWNLGSSTEKIDEHVFGLDLSVQKDQLGIATLSTEALVQGDQNKALRNGINININRKKFNLSQSTSLLNSENTVNKTFFIKNKSDAKLKLGKLAWGAEMEGEFNRWNHLETDSLIANSYSFYEAGSYLESTDSTRNSWKAGYSLRKDYLPLNNSLSAATVGHNFNVRHNYLSPKKQNLKTIFNYRRLQIIDTTLSNSSEEENISSRFETNLKWFKGAITASAFYEIGSGLELKKEYSFIEVNPGQGVYIWNDYNSDNVQQLDEFEEGVYQDTANYIRVFLPGNDYEKILSNQVSLNLTLRPERAWQKKQDLRKLASNFSNQFVFRADRKNLPDNFWDNANPFQINPNEGGLKSVNSNIKNTISFKRRKSKFNIDYLVQSATNKLLLVSGFDTRTNFIQGLRSRWKFLKNWVVNENFEWATKEYTSEIYASKNYEIESIKNELTLSWQAQIDWTLSFTYQYLDKENVLSVEKSTEHKLGPKLSYSVLSKANLTASFNLISIDFNQDDTNTSIAYEMLGGLKPGTNLTWEIQYQQKLAGNLQANLNYSGRKSEGNPTIHIGGVQLRAYF